jgi:hypothetical protein
MDIEMKSDYKIERVIDKCSSDCRYFQKFITENDNFTTAYVCRVKPSLICIESDRKSQYAYDFPSFCVLEDYKGNGSSIESKN